MDFSDQSKGFRKPHFGLHSFSLESSQGESGRERAKPYQFKLGRFEQMERMATRLGDIEASTRDLLRRVGPHQIQWQRGGSYQQGRLVGDANLAARKVGPGAMFGALVREPEIHFSLFETL